MSNFVEAYPLYAASEPCGANPRITVRKVRGDSMVIQDNSQVTSSRGLFPKCECGSDTEVRAGFPFGPHVLYCHESHYQVGICPIITFPYLFLADSQLCPRCHFEAILNRTPQDIENWYAMSGAVKVDNPTFFLCSECRVSKGFDEQAVRDVIDDLDDDNLKLYDEGEIEDIKRAAEDEGREEGERDALDNHECDHSECVSADDPSLVERDEIGRRFHHYWDKHIANQFAIFFDSDDWNTNESIDPTEEILKWFHDTLSDAWNQGDLG